MIPLVMVWPGTGAAQIPSATSTLNGQPELDPIVRALMHRRRELGLSQRGVAKQIDAWSGIISRWETGACMPGLTWVHRWADALELVLTVVPTRSAEHPEGMATTADPVFEAQQAELQRAQRLRTELNS